MKFTFWPGVEVDPNNLEIYVTLTRFTDLPNNSDKYRRFITIGDPTQSVRPYVFTHTGRWTAQTAAGIWSGGTVRPGQLVSQRAFMRANSTVLLTHRHWVTAKRNEYSVVAAHEDELTTWSSCQFLFNRMNPNPVTLGSGFTGAVVPCPSVNPTSGDLDTRVSNLLAAAMAENFDAFDLFEDLAILKQEVGQEFIRVEKLTQDLKLANETILRNI